MKRYLLLSGISLLLASCQMFMQEQEEVKPKEEKKESVYYIGTVYKIYADSNFALIRVVKDKPAAGTTLISHPITGAHIRMANLSVSKETVNNSITPLIAADIRSGDLVVGDAVYIYQAVGAPTPALINGSAPVDADLEQERAILASETQQVHEETSVLPAAVNTPAPREEEKTTSAVLPTLPSSSHANPEEVPDRIKNIPRNFDDWDDM